LFLRVAQKLRTAETKSKNKEQKIERKKKDSKDHVLLPFLVSATWTMETSGGGERRRGT